MVFSGLHNLTVPDNGMQGELLDATRSVADPGEEAAEDADEDGDDEADDAVQVVRGRVQHRLPIAGKEKSMRTQLHMT